MLDGGIALGFAKFKITVVIALVFVLLLAVRLDIFEVLSDALVDLASLLELLLQAGRGVQVAEQGRRGHSPAHQRDFLEDFVEVFQQDAAEVHRNFQAILVASSENVDHTRSNIVLNVFLLELFVLSDVLEESRKVLARLSV